MIVRIGETLLYNNLVQVVHINKLKFNFILILTCSKILLTSLGNVLNNQFELNENFFYVFHSINCRNDGSHYRKPYNGPMQIHNLCTLIYIGLIAPMYGPKINYNFIHADIVHGSINITDSVCSV